MTVAAAMGDVRDHLDDDPGGTTVLGAHRDVVVACAHPDDESFGLGAVITALVEAGARVRLVCFTHGEGSTLGAGEDLAERRDDELTCAAGILGVDEVHVHAYPDGTLRGIPLDRLAGDIVSAAAGADALLTFDHGGITGHPDHQHATDATVAAGEQLAVPVLGWAIPERVAARLRAEFGAPFVGRDEDQLHIELTVDRTRQHAAMACHSSQLTDNPVPHRRIELQGATEHLRVLHRPTAARLRPPGHEEITT